MRSPSVYEPGLRERESHRQKSSLTAGEGLALSCWPSKYRERTLLLLAAPRIKLEGAWKNVLSPTNSNVLLPTVPNFSVLPTGPGLQGSWFVTTGVIKTRTTTKISRLIGRDPRFAQML